MKLPLREFSEVLTMLRGPIESSAASEKRQAARMTVNARVIGYLMDGEKVQRSYSMLMRDISLTGTGVLQTLALPQNSKVVLALPRNAAPLFVLSNVMHCRSLADGILACGIEFVNLVDEAASKNFIKGAADERERLSKAIMV